MPATPPTRSPASSPVNSPATPPAITVVIPHLNAAPALARCLASLTGQNAEFPVEIIVVDNGSAAPAAAECAAECAAAGARLLHEPTPGPGPARSTGAAAATAPVIAFIDADCTAAPGWLAAIAAHFAGPERPDSPKPAEVIGGDVRIALRDPGRPDMIEAYESVFGYRMQLYVERDGYTATCNMAVRAAFFAQVGPFGGIDMAEDVEWGRRARAAGGRIAYLPRMRIATPARESFAELARKWDRQLAHDWAAAIAPGGRGPVLGPILARARWLIRAAAVAVSPLAELPRIARSDRLTGPFSGLRARALAVLGTARIRAWRARRMVQLAAGLDPARLSGGWRKG